MRASVIHRRYVIVHAKRVIKDAGTVEPEKVDDCEGLIGDNGQAVISSTEPEIVLSPVKKRAT